MRTSSTTTTTTKRLSRSADRDPRETTRPLTPWTSSQRASRRESSRETYQTPRFSGTRPCLQRWRWSALLRDRSSCNPQHSPQQVCHPSQFQSPISTALLPTLNTSTKMPLRYQRLPTHHHQTMMSSTTFMSPPPSWWTGSPSPASALPGATQRGPLWKGKVQA